MSKTKPKAALKMPPRRPLTDLCLITTLKFFDPMNQLKASNPSIRTVNRTVKTLVITNRNLVTEFLPR
ncbi:hypothetical protein TYRP_012093 [Tyrophagus putrescentiae]|nr:hypothetical protein TYRP_012093 [Tyrophagus putrescentiae]